MYAFLLPLHSLVRWLVLISLLFTIVRAYRGWLAGKPFSKFDDKLRHTTEIIVQIQFMIGLCLYFFSPLVSYFLHNFKTAVAQREIRFFGMEHVTMMFVAVAIISTVSPGIKRKKTDQEKFKTLAIWFTIALLIILSSIPWAFSPLVSRPWLRGFNW